MKSKSFELGISSSEKNKINKTYDFINFYKPAPESDNGTCIIAERKKTGENSKQNLIFESRIFKRSKMNKNNKKSSAIDIAQVVNNEPHSSIDSKTNVKESIDINSNVKSVMKTDLAADKFIDLSKITPKNKPKKRNKSVSFILNETEEVLVKKAKSEQSPKVIPLKLKKIKKHKNKTISENADKVTESTCTMDFSTSVDNSVHPSSSKVKNKIRKVEELISSNVLTKKNNKNDKKKHKEHILEVKSNIEKNYESNNLTEKTKKSKKLKKLIQSYESMESEGQPKQKCSKKEIKPDVIAENLQNLNIGDNPHTLTNLLDEMAVVDKNKKKKGKKEFKKSKPKNVTSLENVSKTKTDKEAEENDSEEKEKIKWIKRKWNKDKKGNVNDDKLSSSIIIENLPLKIMCTYKKLLMDHFAKFGIIKQVGVAELYSIEEPEVFTTTIYFDSEDAAEKSLEEDNTLFEGNRIRVKKPMPPSQTTLVVRSYAELSETALSTVFTSAGKMRNVRRLVKGKKSMSAAFIEFDGPDAVKRAIKMAEDVKIGGKKIFVAKYETRTKNRKQKNGNILNEDSDRSEI